MTINKYIEIMGAIMLTFLTVALGTLLIIGIIFIISRLV